MAGTVTGVGETCAPRGLPRDGGAIIAPAMSTTPRPGPLTGLRAVDLTEHMAGPFCAMILADMGVDVVKIERPGRGDSSRAMGDGSELNAYFRYINRNKKSVTLDYKSPRGRAVFLALVKAADVLVGTTDPRSWSEPA